MTKDVLQPLTHARIDLNALVYNLRALRRLSLDRQFRLPTRPPQAGRPQHPHEILGVIKADAYGHGMIEVARTLDANGVEFFGVSDVHEGLRLRQEKFGQNILLFESALPEHAPAIVRKRLMPAVGSLALAKVFNREARKLGRRLDVHVKIDTGMGRLGVWHQEAPELIDAILRLPYLRVMGLMTHFPAADTDRTFTENQITRLYDIVTNLDKKGKIIPYIHAANSMGLAGYKTHIFNLSRPGLMLYGLYPDEQLRTSVRLKPVMSVHSRVVFVKNLPKGQSVSYGRTFVSQTPLTVAIVPCGYQDGYFRALSNTAEVLIGGRRCRVLGRITMDQTIVDVSAVANVKVGDPVVILGRQKQEEINADQLADKAGTINYEIVCNLGNRLARQYVGRQS